MEHDASNIRCLVSAGPTREYFDPVRFISNSSSGRMGYAMARAAQQQQWQTTLVSGPVLLDPPENVEFYPVVTGQEMFDALSSRFDQCDVLIMTAAITDIKPSNYAEEKIKKSEFDLNIDFEPIPDVLRALNKKQQIIVGFAAETHMLNENAKNKLHEKNMDYIVANDVSTEYGFGSIDNHVWVFAKDGSEWEYGPESKENIAAKLIELVAGRMLDAGC